MTEMSTRNVFLLLFLNSILSATAQESLPIKPIEKGHQYCAAVTQTTCDIANALGRGINMGNMLEAPREGDWGLRLDPTYIPIVTKAFTTVRLPIRWSNHAGITADASISEFFATRVEKIVDDLLAGGAYVIINVHHYNQLSGGNLNYLEFAVDPSVVETRFINIWAQIATRYKNKSPKLIFEILNEPTGPLEGEPWNRLSAKALETIRQSNPTRVVMIGPSGNRIPSLGLLNLPPDKNLIVAVHNYDPAQFTFQGIDYMPQFPIGLACCNVSQKKSIVDALETAKKWSSKTGYPIHLGEFGSVHNANLSSREAYTRIVRDEAEKRGFGWTYWEFGSYFGVYSPTTRDWIEPLRRALLD